MPAHGQHTGDQTGWGPDGGGAVGSVGLGTGVGGAGTGGGNGSIGVGGPGTGGGSGGGRVMQRR
jgi:hypothetical protein